MEAADVEPPFKKTKSNGLNEYQRLNIDPNSDHGKQCIANEVTFDLVWNDGSDDSSLKLIALKNIFSRQLPKMPKEYIVRLVFDRLHLSLAIKRHNRIIGGICYRPYYEQQFGEIAFCAINSTEQVRGFGSMLMNQLKSYVQWDKLEYFLTYADNFAIGYFQKQGFSKSISMPKDRWVGFIKDYDGGTLMECYIRPSMDYLNVASIVKRQRDFIFQCLKQRKHVQTVWEGVDTFRSGKRVPNISSIPGVEASGWSTFSLYRGATERDRNMAQSKLTANLKPLLDKIRFSAPGRQFAAAATAEYQKKFSLSLDVIQSRHRSGDYYSSQEALLADLIRMVSDARGCSPDPSSPVHSAAVALEDIIIEILGNLPSHAIESIHRSVGIVIKSSAES